MLDGERTPAGKQQAPAARTTRTGADTGPGDAARFAELLLMAELMRAGHGGSAANPTLAGIGAAGTASAGPAGTGHGAVPVVSVEAIAQHVAAQAQAMQEQRRALRIELNPENLGALVVELERSGAQLEVRLHAETEAGGQALAARREELVERLAGLGFASARVLVTTGRADREAITAV